MWYLTTLVIEVIEENENFIERARARVREREWVLL